MIEIKTGFNFTLRLSQISEIYCSLVHLHTYIYRTLYFFHQRLPTRHRMILARHWMLPSLHWMLSDPHKCLICPSSYVKHQIFLSIRIFDVLRVISRVQEDIFPTVYNLHNLALSSDILWGAGIYYPLGTYCSLQSYPLGHVERVRPTDLSVKNIV